MQLISISDSECLQDRLKTVDFAQGEVLAEPDTPIERIGFPRSGLLSVVVDLEDGAQIEAAIIGRSGALGGAAIFGAKQHLSTVVAQLAGRAWTLNVQDALDIAARAAEFRAAMTAQERYLLAQAQQTGACNAKHSIMQRLCSWTDPGNACEDAWRAARAFPCSRADYRNGDCCNTAGVAFRSWMPTRSRRMHVNAAQAYGANASGCSGAAARPKEMALLPAPAEMGRAPRRKFNVSERVNQPPS